MSKIFYDMFLEHEEAVKDNKPDIIKPLAEDMQLELYVADSGAGKNTWAIAVISTKVGEDFFKNKYDSGRIQDDLDDMAEECLVNIRFNWDINYWRQEAKREIKKRTGFWSKLLSLFKK